jgi:hypothetical protein
MNFPCITREVGGVIILHTVPYGSGNGDDCAIFGYIQMIEKYFARLANFKILQNRERSIASSLRRKPV